MDQKQAEYTVRAIARCREIAEQLSTTHPTNPPNLALMEHTFFTPTPVDDFPYIHQANPAQTLDGFPADVLQNWLATPGFKLIARIFDYNSRYYRTHGLPRDILAASIATIVAESPTDSTRLSQLPLPIHTMSSPCMLITVPSSSAQRILLKNRILSSEWITFEALPLNTDSHPSALFTIRSFPSDNPFPPKEFLRAAWSDLKNAKRIANLIREDEQELTTKDVTEHMLNTLALHPFPYPRTQGFGFVVHILTWWSKMDHWADVKRTLLSLEYTTAPNLEQIHLITLPYCSLCHSVDHLCPECPFPLLLLWNGPS